MNKTDKIPKKSIKVRKIEILGKYDLAINNNMIVFLLMTLGR